MLKKLKDYLLSASARKRNRYLASSIYTALWVLGLFSAIASYINLQANRAFGHNVADWVVAGFAIATLLQQYTVYKDFNRMEIDTADMEEDYRGWFDVRLERVLRVLILFFLLFGVGKVADVVYPLTQYHPSIYGLQWLATPLNWFGGILRPADYRENLSHNLFVFGSVLVFILLATWNLLAFILKVATTKKNLKTPEARVHAHMISFRIILFTILSSICAGYWIFVYFGWSALATLTEMWIGIYILLLVFGLALRRDSSRLQIENLVVKFVKEVGKAGGDNGVG